MKILAINNTYSSPTIGGIRSRLLARGLAERGHTVTVVSSSVPGVGGSNEHVREVHVPALSFESILKFFLPRYDAEHIPPSKGSPGGSSVQVGGEWKSLVNRWVMIPDKFLPWIHPAVRAGSKLLQAERFDVIYATQPVRSNLIVGAKLSKKSGVPLVVEYRDLWTDNPYTINSFPTLLHRSLHGWLERNVFRQAARITAVCRGIREVLARKSGGGYGSDIGLHYNFFDSRCFAGIPRNPSTETFRIVYIGALYGTRQPYVFFDGMKKFIDERKLAPDEFRFDCIGRIIRVGDVEVEIERRGLSDYIHLVGMVPHADALQQLVNANTALIVQAPDDESHIPGKLFETFGARTPILLVCPKCETAGILEECAAGVVCEHTPESVSAGLDKLYSHWQTQEAWPFNEEVIEEYSLDKAVVKFEELLQSAIDLNAE